MGKCGCSNDSNSSKTLSPVRTVLMIVVLGLGYSLVMFLRHSLLITSTYMTEDLIMGSTGLALGALGSVSHYGYAVMQIPGGFLADRLGARRIISISLLLMFVATAFFSTATYLTQAIVARAISGVAMAAVYVPAMTAIRDWCPPKNFPFLVSLLVLFGNFGSMCAKTPLVKLADLVGWRKSYLIAAIAALVLALLTWIVVPEKRKSDSRQLLNEQLENKTGTKGQSLWSVMRGTQLMSLILWFFIFNGTLSGFEGLWDMTYLMEVQKLTRPEAAAILTLTIFLGMAIGPIAGALANRRSDLVFLTTSYLRALVLGFFAFLPQSMGYVNTTLWFLAKRIGIACHPVAFSEVKRIAPPELSGTVLGICNTIGFVGGALATQGIGIAMESAAVVGYHRAFSKPFIVFAVLVAATTTFVGIANYWRRQDKILLSEDKEVTGRLPKEGLV